MKINTNLFHYFEQSGLKVNYHPNDMIYMEEDNTSSLYLITKGRVRVFMMSPSGVEITLEILEKGNIFGESSFLQDSPRPTTVTAINEVELISCKLDNLYPFLNESTDLTISLMQMLSNRCDYLAFSLKKAYTYNSEEKVASFLLEQTKHDDNEKDILNDTIPYTHEEIASLIGLSRVTVTNILNKFEKAGYIKISYRHTKVLDKEALASLLPK